MQPHRARGNRAWLVLTAAAVGLVFGACGSKKTTVTDENTPVIDGANPNMIPAGSPDTTLTINGENFKSAVAKAFDVPLPDDSVSETQIVTTLPANMLELPGTIPITVIDVEPGGNLVSNVFSVVVTSGTPTGPTLAASKMHTGNFTQGETGATYTVNVSNTGSGATDGSTVTVTDMLPAGLTLTGMSGTGWTCNNTMVTCDRTDVLNGGTGYPSITVTVNVATNAPATVTNQVTVTGGGSGPATAMDQTTINPAGGTPAFTIGITPSAPTFPPASSESYSIHIVNSGAASTTGTTTVMITLDSNQILGSMGISGTGSSCNNTTLTCMFSGTLAAGQSFDLSVPVDVLNNGESQVSITIVVAGSGITAMKTQSVPT